MAAEPKTQDTTKQIVCEPAIMPAPPMSSWNDKRLDELSARTDAGFKRVDEEFKAVRQEMGAGFARLDQRLDRLTNTLIGASVGLVFSVILLICSMATGILG